MIKLVLSNVEALAALAAMEAWRTDALSDALDGPIGRLAATGVASPYSSAMEALQARYGPAD